MVNLLLPSAFSIERFITYLYSWGVRHTWQW
jgi:hypothetical protein